MGAGGLPDPDASRNRSLNGVVAALASEARALGPSMRRDRDETFGGLSQLMDGTLLAVSGIGYPAAGAAARALVEAQVSSLMSFGLAGALDPELAAGSIILPNALISRDGARFVTCKAWRERVAASLGYARVTEGTLLSSARAIETPLEKAAAFRDTGAAAVDMESAAVAEVAAAHKLPFIAVRVIVDTAADALPPSVVAASQAGGVQIGRLIAGLVKAPGEIAALLRLARRYRTAMRSLRTVGTHLT
jgi:adenosylhomocysteine nucleosidase